MERRRRESEKAHLYEPVIRSRKGRAVSLDHSQAKQATSKDREVTFSHLEKRRRGKEKEERTLRSTNKTPKVTNHLLGTVKERDLPAHSSDKKHRKLSEVQKSVPIKEWHPLMEVGSLHEGQFWIMGNRSLISLNLSRNQIGEAGLRQLLKMIQVTVENKIRNKVNCRRSEREKKKKKDNKI